MCGIAGIISLNPTNISKHRLQKMTDSIIHRGPEAEGFWINETCVAGFGHRRLCIIDLTDSAFQPMHYLNRYTITYNGEIYNYIELKQSLRQKGYTFHSNSDTEVILACYACYGKDCLQYFDGMYAFAIWDEKDKILFCARDRFGEKPFYFFKNDDQFVFASEMKALWAAGIQKQIDNTMLLNYITLGYTTNPSNSSRTFYKNIYQLSHSNWLELNLNKQKEEQLHISSYWDIDKETTIDISEEQAIEKFTDLLETSVKRRLRSDVAVGTSLSGGLDSSSIATLMQSQLTGTNTHKAFSAVFAGFEKDESEYIQLVSDQFSIKSFTTTPTSDGLIKDLEKLVYYQEEPFQSASIYAQYKVYELAKENGVTVLLDGQGADETLAGYHKYYHWFWQEQVARHHFKTAQKEIAAAKILGVRLSWRIKNYASAFLPGLTARQLEKKALNQQKMLQFVNKDFFVDSFDKTSIYKPVVDKLNDLLYYNTFQFGLQELLRYADRNSMAHSREVRLPFLNHELVQFIFSLPSHYKIKNGWTKWILRESMKAKLPNEVVWRKDKVGFEPPQQQWMQQTRLQDYIYESKRKLVKNGVLKEDILNNPIKPESSHAYPNFDWRYFCAACYL